MTDAANAVAAAPRIWRRFSAAQRTARFAVYLIIVAAIVAALQTIEIIPEFLADAPEQIGDLLTRMWPIDWHAYPTEVHAALMETIHIASLGTLLALLLALPIGLLAAHNLVPFTPLNLLAKLNEADLRNYPGSSELAARISSYELAYRMQSCAPETVNVDSESEATRKLYGLDDKVTEPFGRQCIMARRLVERGVRFVQLYHGGLGQQNRDTWDAHDDVKDNHTRHAAGRT